MVSVLVFKPDDHYFESRRALLIAQSPGSASTCFSWSAFVCLSPSHHRGFANTHTQAWNFHRCFGLMIFLCLPRPQLLTYNKLKSWHAYPRALQTLKVLCAWYRWRYVACIGPSNSCTVHSFTILKLYLVIDLKVLVKSFNCEDRSCYVGNPRESFFRVRESIHESFAKVYTYTTRKGLPLPAALGSGRRRVPENFGLVPVQFAVWCCTPDIYLSLHRWRPSFQRWGFATSTSLLALPNIAFWSLKKQTPHAAVKLPKVRLCQSQTPTPLVFAFPLLRPPADGWGLSIGVFLWKFRESFAEERAKVKVHFDGVGPVSLAKSYAWGPNQQPSTLKRDSLMLSACL